MVGFSEVFAYVVLISSLQIFEVLAFSVIHGFILLVLVNCVASHMRICAMAGVMFVLSSDFLHALLLVTFFL